jgi:hypothetical protein
MAERLLRSFGVIVFFGLCASGCASEETMGSSGTGAASTGGAAATSTRNIDRIASGAAEDSLNACLARIPKDASAGQKMMAEQSCNRDQANRR